MKLRNVPQQLVPCIFLGMHHVSLRQVLSVSGPAEELGDWLVYALSFRFTGGGSSCRGALFYFSIRIS